MTLAERNLEQRVHAPLARPAWRGFPIDRPEHFSIASPHQSVRPGGYCPRGGSEEMRQLVRVVVDQIVPAALTAALHVAQRLGWVTVLPLSLVIQREYGNYGLTLGVAAALVAGGTFAREGQPFGIAGFLATALAGVAMASPFILARYGLYLGLAPTHFAIVATFAYLGFHMAIGLLVGGCWSIGVKTFREQRLLDSWREPSSRC